MKPNWICRAAIAAIVALMYQASASAQTAPSLGSAESFAVLAGTTVTNTGPSVIGGNVGVSPNNAITGFPPGTVLPPGAIHLANATAAAAQASLTTVYNNLAGQPTTQTLTGIDLGTLPPLGPGVYTFATSAQLTGTLILDAQGNAGAVWIFQMGSTLTTASNSTVAIINGGQPCNVFWQVGSSATLGTTTTFVGNIVALTSITLNTGAAIAGRALARSGAVTLDTNRVSNALCFAAGDTPPAGCPVIGLNPPVLPGGQVGVAYSQRFLANSGTEPYFYTVRNGTLPAGLTLSTAGVLAGTPTNSIPQTFSIRATDVLGCFVQQPYAFVFGVGVPTLPQTAALLLAMGLLAAGYMRLRQRQTSG